MNMIHKIMVVLVFPHSPTYHVHSSEHLLACAPETGDAGDAIVLVLVIVCTLGILLDPASLPHHTMSDTWFQLFLQQPMGIRCH